MMIPVDKPSDIPPAELADMEQVRRLIAEGKRVDGVRSGRRSPRTPWMGSDPPHPPTPQIFLGLTPEIS